MGKRGNIVLTDFKEDILRGGIGEDIFKKDFLEFLNIHYIDVTGSQKFQAIDTDLISKIGLYEIKTNYKDNDKIVIEEYTNINESLGNISFGWFYKSQADMLVFISKTTRTMILIPFTDKFKEHYNSIKDNHSLCRNKISVYGDKSWQSAFRIIPLESIVGYYSKYRRMNSNIAT